MTSEFDREQRLRRLLADAVDPVEPAPGAQARLLARARAQRNRRPWHQRPLMTRWVPGVLATLLVIAGITVVVTTHSGDGSGASTAGSAAAGAPATAPAPEHSAQRGSEAQASVSPEAANASGLSREKSLGGATYGGGRSKALAPLSLSLVPSDLDGDGRPDTFTLGAGTLAAQLTRYGLEAVSLPPLGPGARVLGTSSLTDQNGSPVAVVFVRLRQVGSTSTDTIASLVDGHLTVLKQGSGPVLLTTDANHGYACNQGTLKLSGDSAALVVEGAQLVSLRAVRAAAAAPATRTSCF